MIAAHRVYSALRRIAGPCAAFRISRALAAWKGQA